MQADYQDLESLLEVQRIDLMIMQIKKQRVELPQRIQVMRLRKKRDQIAAKLEQVEELKQKAQRELTVVEDEDRGLAEKQARAQEFIDASGSDYRKVESRSKEMAGMAKRRETLAEKTLEIEEQLAKIEGVRSQLQSAVDTSNAEEARLRSEFEADDTALVEQAKNLSAMRAEIEAALPASLVSLYEKTTAKAGGGGIGKLEESTCGICRTSIDGGRLIELRSQAPLGVCPNCKRLLVIE